MGGKYAPAPAQPAPTPGGTIDFYAAYDQASKNAAPTASPRAIPTDSSGMVSVWNLPGFLTQKDPKTGKPIQLWFDTGHDGGQWGVGSVNGQRADVQINKPHSFNVNASASDIMKQFAAMSANDPLGFESIQKLLFRGQFYSATGQPVLGFHKDTEAALRDAMTQYLKVSQGAGVAVSFKDWLQQNADANDPSGAGALGGKGGKGGAGSTPAVPAGPSLTDPDQLRLYAQKAAQSALGRNLNSAQLDNFVKQFHDQQIQTFNTAQAGGQDVQKNDPSASAISFVTGNNQAEFNQHQTQAYGDSFLNMFLSGPSSAPNVSPDQSAGGV